MKVLIQNARIIDPESPHHMQVSDISLADGKIAGIAPGGTIDPDGMETIAADGLYVSQGWMDMRTSLRDPGFEYKEDLYSAAMAACYGGFTAVACLPDTFPVLQSKSEVGYVVNKSILLPAEIKPLGALTHQLEGKEIAEMYDMHMAGAVAFSNGNTAVSSAGVMQRALLYVKSFDGLVYTHPEDRSISAGGQMHEGVNSTLLGLKGMPSLAEYVAVKRDIELLRYTESRMHISHISTAESVELVRQAKKEGLQITCDVAIHNLVFDDSAVDTYDTFYKLNPPLRLASDIAALKEGLKDGTIDAIISDHCPEDVEHKNVEFDYAAFGIIGLQTLFPLALKALEGILTLEELVTRLAHHPRRILKQPVATIATGNTANLTIFSTTATWTYTRENNQSRSHNSPLLGRELTGRAIATYHHYQLHHINL